MSLTLALLLTVSTELSSSNEIKPLEATVHTELSSRRGFNPAEIRVHSPYTDYTEYLSEKSRESISGIAQPADKFVTKVEDFHEAFITDVFFIGVGGAVDLYSTAYALHRNSNARESNPLGFNTEARGALKVGMGLTGSLFCYKIRKAGSGRAATFLRYGIFSIQAAAAVNNFFIASKK